MIEHVGRIIAQRTHRSNRVTLFIRLADGTLRVLESAFFENRKTLRSCDQVFKTELVRHALCRVAKLALGYEPAVGELHFFKRHRLVNSSSTTRVIFLMVYTPPPGWQCPGHLEKYLIDPEQPPQVYTLSHQKLLKEFADEVRAQFVTDKRRVTVVNAA
jgi:hypothetical protein